MEEVKIVCVLRSGGDFKPEHVQRLLSQLREVGRWEGWFVYLSDLVIPNMGLHTEFRRLRQKWPGWWSKLEMCAPENDCLGNIFYMDLDTTVVGDVNALANAGQLTMLSDYDRPWLAASGLMWMTVAARQKAWEFLQRIEPERAIKKYWRRGDQKFFAAAWERWDGKGAAWWQKTFPGAVAFYEPGQVLGPDVRLVVHHGFPRPWQI